MYRLTTLILAVCFAALAAGCADGGGSSTSAGPADAVSRAPRPDTGSAVPRARRPDDGSAPPAIDIDSAPIVVYTDDGFTPSRLEIEAGQTVVFVNESGGQMWPASNIHPTHESLPALDALKLLEPSESWSFTFDEPGFWRYHNHMSPSSGGLIVVAGESVARVLKPLSSDADGMVFKELGTVPLDDSIALLQDDDLVRRYLQDHGPAATIELIAETALQTGVDCHGRAHELGRMTYDLYGASAFSLSGHECHSGGYHGATEALFRDRGTANLQADIAVVCANASNGFFRHQCIHGVGHGLMAWTGYEIFDGLELCDALGTVGDRQSCYSGVFMENVVGGLSGSMGHFTDYLSDDPHYPCNVLDEKYVASCYFYQTSRMVQLVGGDFERVAAACAEAPTSSRRLCFQSMGRDVGGSTRGDPARAIVSCSYVDDPENRIECLEGAVQDSFWDPSGADNALGFCGLLKVDGEVDRCYATIVGRAHDIYPDRADLAAFCARVPESRRAGCP